MVQEIRNDLLKELEEMALRSRDVCDYLYSSAPFAYMYGRCPEISCGLAYEIFDGIRKDLLEKYC